MARYRTSGRLDDQVLQDGDRGFIGIDSYQEATSLQPGFVQTSENMRLVGDLAEVRKGIDFLAGSVTLTYNGSDERVFASTLFSDPATGTEFVVVATKTKAIIWNDANNSGIAIDYPGGEVVAEADGASFVQNFEKLILFRGTDKRPLQWDGNFSSPTDFTVKTDTASGAGIACPNSTFGISFRNRLIIANPVTGSGPPGDSNYSVIMSDLLDSNNFTAADSQFRLNKGSADFLVGFIPYQEDQLIVFMRNSIHMINNIATTSAANTYEITRQHGCVARKSIAQSGPQTFFLSDNGVIVLSPGTDPAKGLGVAISKISGETIPMTRPIQDQFDEVNFAAADKACGVVYDNKYYLAVPTGSSTVPNKIFVYNLLTSTWISVDDYPAMSGSLAFHVDDWVICSHGSAPTRRRLFACNDTGWYLMEENAIDDSGRKIGSTSESGTTAIAGKLVSRSFTFGDIGVKSWKRGQVGANTVNSDAFNIKVNTLDPDASTTVLSHTADGTEEALFRFGTGRTRGYGANIEINVTAGTPSFRHLSLEAIGAGANARREIA
jgi:hypothetical protein|tara:strand:+ start:673 stop:2325 length:1653 start_codon:yes stop_codon:yes gene_type:complete